MFEGVSLQNPIFVNTAANICGVLLFGLLIVLLISGWEKNEDRQRGASLTAASFAFIWNLGSLIGLASSHPDGQVADWLVAVNFSALSLLPAILLKIVLRQKYRLLAYAGYLLSAVSVVLHFAELRFRSEGLHEAALLLITFGFGVLIAGVLALSGFKQDRSISLTDVICLLLFTISFLHFGYGHSNTAWTNEVAWHHASIPLALIVLLRDYRLLLLETFIRFVVNFGLAGLFTLLLYWAAKTGYLLERARGNAFAAGVLFISCCFSLVLFAYLRSLLQKQLTRAVFRRGDLTLCSSRILQISSESHSEKELLDKAAAELCRFVQAERFLVVSNSGAEGTGRSDHCWAETELPLRFSRGDSVNVLLGPKRGSGRYLPEDIQALTQLSGLLTAQVERFRTTELQRLANEAELRALQAQINPHFLFNAFNTLYGTIGRESFQARRLVLNLADLFRYCLQRDRAFIPLGDELSIVQAYLEIESLRLGDRLATEVSASERAREVMIPILSVQPLVENAIRHGVSRRSAKGELRVSAKEFDTFLQIVVEDNGPGFEGQEKTNGLGMALDNVRQRLHLCYGSSSGLDIQSSPEGTSVTLTIPLEGRGDANVLLLPLAGRPTTAGTLS
ncbi:MAG: histidine kinase [Acidobacteriaceae bacterium]|nr:histidine kinase [Acidobacteriaceae bacterium]